ncbi:MAG: LysR substrate-binding domain-containing protein [Rhodoferax sp.]
MKTHPSRLIPAVTNLLVFEVCARHLSFTRAGQTLGLSQGAVSRQVSELETYLGQPLFVRAQRSLSLTPAGQHFIEQIGPHLKGLEEATIALRLGRAQAGVLRVSASVSLCNRWLVPRLADLLRSHPELVISLSPEWGFGDNSPGTSDVMLVQREYAPLATEGAELLLPIYGSAVCAPQLLAGATTLGLEELLRLPLLHYVEAPNMWQDYVNDTGRPDIAAPAGASNTTFIVNIQFALAGLGVALLPEYLVEEELASCRLVRAHVHRFKTGRAYYLVCPETRRHSPPVLAFRQWIVQQAQACRDRYN